MDNNAQDLIDGIGCLAELLTVFYTTLHRGGMSEHYSLELTARLLDNLVGGMIGVEEESED